MNATRTSMNVGSPELQWTDPSGSRWSATLVRRPRRPAEEYEIQVDGEGVAPDRVLCVGLREPRFRELATEELELIRRAAQARHGILWLDTRDGQIWWVRERRREPSRAQPTYTSARWTGIAPIHPGIPVTLLGRSAHQRLLDHARKRSA